MFPAFWRQHICNDESEPCRFSVIGIQAGLCDHLSPLDALISGIFYHADLETVESNHSLKSEFGWSFLQHVSDSLRHSHDPTGVAQLLDGWSDRIKIFNRGPGHRYSELWNQPVRPQTTSKTGRDWLDRAVNYPGDVNSLTRNNHGQRTGALKSVIRAIRLFFLNSNMAKWFRNFLIGLLNEPPRNEKRNIAASIEALLVIPAKEIAAKFQLWVFILVVSPCLTRGPVKISMSYAAWIPDRRPG